MGTPERLYGERLLSEQRDGCLRDADIAEVSALQDFGFQLFAMARDEERRAAKHCPDLGTPNCKRATGAEK